MCWPTSTAPAPPTDLPRRSMDDWNTCAARPSGSATSPTTSHDRSSRPADSDPTYTLDPDEPRKIRAKLVLELRAEGLSRRAIAASQSMSRNSVRAGPGAADRAGASWDDVSGMSEGEVYSLLFPGRGDHESVYAQPDLEKVHRELSRVGVTLKLLHGEY